MSQVPLRARARRQALAPDQKNMQGSEPGDKSRVSKDIVKKDGGHIYP